LKFLLGATAILFTEKSAVEDLLVGGEATVMRRTDLQFGIRHLMIGVAVAAIGLFIFRATWDKTDEVIIRQYSKDWRPWNRGDAVRVRLNIDRLGAYHLSKDDVMRALTPSGWVDPKVPPPPPGVVFDARLCTPEQYEKVILKENADGEIIRLKDVAKVEFGW
jgi:AcrB/AcrD/AcrF family